MVYQVLNVTFWSTAHFTPRFIEAQELAEAQAPELVEESDPVQALELVEEQDLAQALVLVVVAVLVLVVSRSPTRKQRDK